MKKRSECTCVCHDSHGAALHIMPCCEPDEAWLEPRPTNPNNCSTCEWKAGDDKGHCYMFFDEPTEVCMQHTGRKKVCIALPASLMGLVMLAAELANAPELTTDTMKRPWLANMGIDEARYDEATELKVTPKQRLDRLFSMLEPAPRQPWMDNLDRQTTGLEPLKLSGKMLTIPMDSDDLMHDDRCRVTIGDGLCNCAFGVGRNHE